jgi:type II restriction enzyme
MQPYLSHINSFESLVTTYEQTRSGFVQLALEKNNRMSPYVSEARTLHTIAASVTTPSKLLDIPEIQAGLMTASGISDKASKHLTKEDIRQAIQTMIEKYLEPQGSKFVEELVYRYLLVKGDALGGTMRNVAGALGQWKFTRAMLSALNLAGIDYQWLSTGEWMPKLDDETGIEQNIKGLSWASISTGQQRTMIYNLTVPIVSKNIDICLFDSVANTPQTLVRQPEITLLLGELKGGIDPAGADEHWKTANTALQRIRSKYQERDLHPKTIFVGAAIENAMAGEIWGQLSSGELTHAANLTNDTQLTKLTEWLIAL